MTEHRKEKIAFLGLGAMGSRMATRICDAGYRVTIWNRSAVPVEDLIGKGAQLAATPKEAVKDADYAIAMLRDDDASREVWLSKKNGAAYALGKGALVIEASTLTPVWTRYLSKEILSQGGGFIEAPVIGSRPQAEQGQLIVLAGGEAKDIEAARSLLSSYAKAVYHCGPVGHAAMAKLSINALFAIQIAAIGECLAILDKAGMDAGSFVNILADLPIASPAMILSARAMLAKNFAPLFPIELVAKDLTYAAKLAPEGQMHAGMIEAAKTLYIEASEKGLADKNINSIAELFQMDRKCRVRA